MKAGYNKTCYTHKINTQPGTKTKLGETIRFNSFPHCSVSLPAAGSNTKVAKNRHFPILPKPVPEQGCGKHVCMSLWLTCHTREQHRDSVIMTQPHVQDKPSARIRGSFYLPPLSCVKDIDAGKGGAVLHVAKAGCRPGQ